MRNLLFLIAAALGALLPSCTPANRVVENPLIETANTRTLDSPSSVTNGVPSGIVLTTI